MARVVERDHGARVVVVPLPRFPSPLAVSTERVLEDELARGVSALVSAVWKRSEEFAAVSADQHERLVQLLEDLAVYLESRPVELPATKVLRTKSAQGTIGVTSFRLLKSRLESIGGGLSEAGRECFEAGFRVLIDRLWVESSSAVMEDFQKAYKLYATEDTEQWSLRLPRPLYVKAVTTAKAREVSQSHLACLCLAVGLSLQNKSK